MSETFKPITKFEVLPAQMAQRIMEAGWPIVSGSIDLSVGAGQIDTNSKAVWTTDGRRVVVFFKDAFIISQSKEIDPLYQQRKQELNGH